MMTGIGDDDDTGLDDLHKDGSDNADGSRNGLTRSWDHLY